MTITVMQNNRGVAVAIQEEDLRNFQSLVDAVLTLKLKPNARVRDHAPRTIINGHEYRGVLTLVDATNRLQANLLDDEEIALITVDIPKTNLRAVSTSYHIPVGRTVSGNWNLLSRGNVVRRRGPNPEEFKDHKLSIRCRYLGI